MSPRCYTWTNPPLFLAKQNVQKNTRLNKKRVFLANFQKKLSVDILSTIGFPAVL